MYLVEIKFEIISDYEQDKQEELIEYLYADWSSNGQILSDSYQYAKTTTGYKMYQTIPEKTHCQINIITNMQKSILQI